MFQNLLKHFVSASLRQRFVSAQSALSQRLVMITNHLHTPYGSPELYF